MNTNVEPGGLGVPFPERVALLQHGYYDSLAVTGGPDGVRLAERTEATLVTGDEGPVAAVRFKWAVEGIHALEGVAATLVYDEARGAYDIANIEVGFHEPYGDTWPALYYRGTLDGLSLLPADGFEPEPAQQLGLDAEERAAFLRDAVPAIRALTADATDLLGRNRGFVRAWTEAGLARWHDLERQRDDDMRGYRDQPDDRTWPGF